VLVGRAPAGARQALAAEREPEPEGQQHARGDELERPTAGQQIDADDRAGDHPGQRPGDEQPGEWVQQPPLMREPQQPAGDRDNVEQQVRWCDRRAGDVQDAELNRQQ
jgi:hypothetical protein